jgi:hypothetical protein
LKVLYIVGNYRSGTTLTSNLLGQIPGVTNLGEVRAVFRNFAKDATCGCGSVLKDCPLWGQIAKELNLTDISTLKQCLSLQDNLLGWKHTWIKALKTLYNRNTFNPGQQQLLSVLEKIYLKAAQLTNSQIIVDSSKEIVDALLLLNSTTVDLYILHLIRDPCGVVFSTLRAEGRNSHSFLSMPRSAYLALNWSITNYLAIRLKKSMVTSKYLQLNYDRLISEPQQSLQRLLDFLDHKSRITFINMNHASLQPTHSADGNPNRFFTGDVQLRPDVSWINELSPFNCFAIKLITSRTYKTVSESTV